MSDTSQSDTTQATDLESTIHLLQQNLASADPVVAIVLIERWEKQLQETEIFGDLGELKQAVLSGNISDISKLLKALGQETSAAAAEIEDESAEMAAKIEEMGKLLAQAGNTLK
ncbi:MAG: hypothetical protein KME16_02395 [Scytolyngbya sp. HA4215-MV1]|jgi:hypothetical protein|nr:hypothetical protein [Scytolyngbya sp. HA4215-MV1]